MRKLVTSFVMIFVVAFGSTSTFAATNATVDYPAFNNLINNVIQANGSLHIDGTTTNWMLLYSIALEDDFDNAFPKAYVVTNVINKNGKKYMSISTSNEAQWSSNFFCVAFIKTVCRDLDKGTSLWVRGAKFDTSDLPAVGTVLGTFNSAGKYNGGHVLVYWGEASSGNHYVIDQNWAEPWDYIVRRHTMTDAQLKDYYIVQY